MTGKVIIVGAGPGDPGLITVKGLEALRKADVVIYDRLVPEELLREAKPGAELIFAGKAPGRRALEQGQINRLMVRKAREGKLVVRLKGGDPTVLGRGGEEMVALARAGVDFEIVPGITSAIAAPAAANIPVTHRGVSSSFAVATGREDPSKPERAVDFRRIAKAVDTVVVLMGLGRLEGVCRELLEGGLPPTTPAALVKDATTPRQAVVEGTLGDIAEKARAAGIEPPAVLVVGQVVRVRKEVEALKSEEKLILTFRPEETAGELETVLAEAGYACVNIPAARVVPIAGTADVDEALAGGVDCAVFTSQVSVKVLEDALAEGGSWERLAKALEEARVVAIGPKTREALERRGIRVDAVPEKYCSSELVKALVSRDLQGTKVVLFRSADADRTVEEELRAAGAEVRTVPTHRLEPSGQLSAAAELVKSGRVRALILTSSLIARFVDRELRRAGTSLSEVSERVVIFSIGPATSKALAELGVKEFVEADEHTAQGLYRAVMRTLRGEDCG